MERTNSEMQVLQKRLLRAIGITRQVAEAEYGIKDVVKFVLETSIAQVTRILDTPSHPLRLALLSTNRTSTAFPFTVPRVHGEKFNHNAVMIALRHLRDNVYSTARLRPAAAIQPALLQLPQQVAPRAGGKQCPNKWCTDPTYGGKLYKRLDLNLKA